MLPRGARLGKGGSGVAHDLKREEATKDDQYHVVMQTLNIEYGYVLIVKKSSRDSFST